MEIHFKNTLLENGGTAMDEKLMSLSFSIQSNKGIYALLLGSGISYSAGIPTGWGILKELCKRIMIISGVEEEDEIAWYREHFKKEPLYDEVIEMLAKTPTERMGLLGEFFIPSEEDIKQKIKVPTLAHRSIAKLVKEGYIKVIITTNFDRLLEQALDELNIQYQTLYHDSDIEGMKPLAHAECTVLKIHGDYRDTRFKNITNELESYSEPLTNILGNIFDNYGLILSGWSAEWDTALRDTIKTVKGRRYSWYWHSLNSDIPEKAKELIKFRDASIIVDSKGADHLLSELADNVSSISEMKKVNPESIQLKTQRLKRYLIDSNEIGIRDLITGETLKLIQYINSHAIKGEVTTDTAAEYVNQIKEKSKTLLILMSVLAYYAKTQKQEILIIETLERFTTKDYQSSGSMTQNARQLPLQLTFYSVGISLAKSQNYKLLNKVFTQPKVRDRYASRSNFLWYTSPSKGLWQLFQYLERGNSSFLPMEEAVFPYLKEIFESSNLAIDNTEYEIFYDYFEFLRSIKHRFLDLDYYSFGRYGYKDDKEHLIKFISDGKAIENWEVLELTGNSRIEFKKALEKLTRNLNEKSFSSGEELLRAFIN